MNTADKMKGIKAHFDAEAKRFDCQIRTMVPGYEEMMSAVIASLPYPSSRALRVVDLGTGTGALAYRVLKKYPKAKLTCVDISDAMLAMASHKLKGADAKFIHSDFYRYTFTGKYDAVVSSLALHHLVTDADKHAFYRKIFRALGSGGVFINADVVLGATDTLHRTMLDQWKFFMQKSISPAGIRKTFANYRREDSPATIRSHITGLADAGFRDIDVVWKQCMGAVIYAAK